MTQAVENKMRGMRAGYKWNMTYLRQPVETGLYRVACHICPEYDGGRWKFRGNGEIGYAFPDNKGTFHCINRAAHYEADVSAEVFGLAVTIYFLNHMAWQTSVARLAAWYSQQFYALRNWAYDHLSEEDAGKLYNLLD